MKFTAYDPKNGKLRARLEQPTPETVPGFRVINGWYDGATSYVEHSNIVDRPIVGLPVMHSLSVGDAWVISPIPDATTVVIDGVDSGQIDSGEAVQFEVAGAYTLELIPPFPWVGGKCGVTVT